MAAEEEKAIPQADGDPQEPPLLCNHVICLIDTDAKGLLNIKIDLPDDSRVNLVGDITYFTWLVGKLMRFLGSLLETSSRSIIEKQLRKEGH